MTHCAIQDTTASALICPKPRRLLTSLFRWHLLGHHHYGEPSDSSKADAFDAILTNGIERFSITRMGSPHPFFNGSPPRRVANPLVRDVRFGSEKLTPVSSLSPVSARNEGEGEGKICVPNVRANFESKPTARVEGFDCSSISSLV